jgi:A/G-specific adenine glycosylase
MNAVVGTMTRPIAARLLAWFDRHGRKDLPWQHDRTPHRVWVSEIMLQQTQVGTVIPYFDAFMQRFPDAAALARSPIDEVLHHWSGLGYYARARHLHRAAQIVVERHGGAFPQSLEAAMELPGIGRSTAGAILALAYGERHAILDGNVKRVLARYCGVEGFPGEPATSRALWALSDAYTPYDRVGDYTQAIMDLGATVCVPRGPACVRCPLSDDCAARLSGRQHELPAPRPRRARRTKTTFMLLAIRAGGHVLLEQRPPHGIWGGLWGLPEFPSADAAREWSMRALQIRAAAAQPLGTLRHSFTHFDLQIEPIRIECEGASGVMESARYVWYDPAAPQRVGIAAPIRTLIAMALPGG